LYYDILESCQKALQLEDDFVLKLQNKAQSILNDCRIKFKSE
jgi:hypothetical protein